MSRLRPRWPTLPAGFVGDVLAGHSAVALALGALIYLVCVTGTLCVFLPQLQLWEQPAPAPAAFDPASSGRLVAEAVAKAGGPSKTPFVFLRGPLSGDERTVLSVGERKWTPAPDGRLVALNLPWADLIEDLHIYLSLPRRVGELIVGLLGMGLFSLLLTGVLAHPRILRDAFVLRLGGTRRLQEADLHNRLGVWGLPFHLAVTLSGALFGLASLVYLATADLGYHGDLERPTAPYGAPDTRPDPRPAPLPPLDRIVEDALSYRPDAKLFYFGVEAPGTRGAKVTVEATAQGRLPRGESFYYDQAGRQTGRTRYATGDLGLQLYSGAAQVHFGAFGGTPVRLAYGVLGWALCWVCAGGTSIWLARRRDRGRPAPRLEKAWSALVWGAPLALTVAAFGLAPARTFWIALAALLALSQLAPIAAWSSRRVDRLCRAALAATLAALALSALPRSLGCGAALWVEAALALAAAILALSCVGKRRLWRTSLATSGEPDRARA